VDVAASAVSGGGGIRKSAGSRCTSGYSSLKLTSLSLSGRSTTRGDGRIVRTVGRTGSSVVSVLLGHRRNKAVVERHDRPVAVPGDRQMLSDLVAGRRSVAVHADRQMLGNPAA